MKKKEVKEMMMRLIDVHEIWLGANLGSNQWKLNKTRHILALTIGELKSYLDAERQQNNTEAALAEATESLKETKCLLEACWDELKEAQADRDWLAGQLGDCAAIEVTLKNGKPLQKTMDKQWWLDAGVRARITLPELAKRSETAI